MKIKMILAILFAILMLSGCSSHEAPAEPESPDQKQEEHLQETDPTKDDGSDEQTKDLPTQQDEPREEVVNTESPAVEKEPDSDTSDVAPKPEQKPSAPEERPSVPEQKPSAPTEPEDNEEKDEPCVPSEPTVPSQPDLPDDPVQEKPETEGKEDDQNTPSAQEPVKEPIDQEALIRTGLQYAADTYGYEISVGVRDGYYPSYYCVFDTMEDGVACIKRCVDDTTRALLARPGTQIVVEIDGVICRARIDITMQDHGDDTYSVTVYYG